MTRNGNWIGSLDVAIPQSPPCTLGGEVIAVPSNEINAIFDWTVCSVGYTAKCFEELTQRLLDTRLL